MEEMRDKNGTGNREKQMWKYQKEILPYQLVFPFLHLISYIKSNSSFQKTDINKRIKYTIQYLFMIKILIQIEIEGNFFNNIKDMYEKSTADIPFSGGRLKAFPIMISTFTTAIQHCIRNYSRGY